MSFAMILPAYLIWHYGTAYTDILRLWINYIWFLYNFFSIPILFQTLFSPWQRITERRRRAGFDMEDVAEMVVVNTIMRFIGFFIRMIFIIVGSVTVAIVFLAGLVFMVFWPLAPFLAPVFIIYGFSLFL